MANTYSMRSIANELDISVRSLTRLGAAGAFPRAKGLRTQRNEAWRVRVMAAWKLFKSKMPRSRIAKHLEKLSEAELYKTAGLPLPASLAPTPPAPPPSTLPTAVAPMVAAALAPTSPTPQSATWLRMPLADGVELHVRLGTLDLRAIESLTTTLGKVVNPGAPS